MGPKPVDTFGNRQLTQSAFPGAGVLATIRSGHGQRVGRRMATAHYLRREFLLFKTSSKHGASIGPRTNARKRGGNSAPCALARSVLMPRSSDKIQAFLS